MIRCRGSGGCGATLRSGAPICGGMPMSARTFTAALGLVIAATQGGAVAAFALAGIVYIMIGLAYTELAAAYPVAGGGQYFSLRGWEISRIRLRFGSFA